MDALALDFVIVGAGISGINCAFRLQNEIPEASYLILESRNTIGGTWDVWNYPGVRCDSDISTIAFSWHLWSFPHAIAPGRLIAEYVRDAASKHDIIKHIQFRHKVLSADWTSTEQRWTLSVMHDGQQKRFSTRFLMLGTGYFDYDKPFKPDIPGIEKFGGRIINPQLWPAEYDCTNQRLAVIGSGTTAVSMMPALAEKAAQVIMVQRSPTWIVKWDNGPSWAHKYLPLSLVYTCRRIWCLIRLYLYVRFCDAYPETVKGLMRQETKKELPGWVPFEPHFQPRYDPWVQRLTVDPDAAFLKALHRPNVRLITGDIGTVTENGLKTCDGETVEADTIVTATGFHMQLGGNIRIHVDNEELVWKDRLVWNGAMLSGIPNMVFAVGYPKNSWTPGADVAAFILIRLYNNLKSKGLRSVAPREPRDAAAMQRSRLWEFESTLVRRADATMPVCGDTGPWRRRQNPFVDWLYARWGNIMRDLEFVN
ncbi:hypothetical protein GGR56DRAFT_697357 [Xylariaceae sp. FL0804]|nr:hypothetical protein GGR56DRAFT_697357 [Xylariaceae sp. FL0804]